MLITIQIFQVRGVCHSCLRKCASLLVNEVSQMLLSWRPMSWGTESWKWISKACLTLRVCQCFIEVSSLLSSHKTVCPWLLPFVLSDVGLVFFEPGGKGMASLFNVDFTAFTGNSVKTRLLVGGSSIDWILIEEQCLTSISATYRIISRGTMSHLEVHSLQDPLQFLWSGLQKGRNNSTPRLVMGGIGSFR